MQDSGFFFYKTVGGSAAPTWRTKLLVWAMPSLIISWGLFLAFSSFVWVSNAVETTGTVTSVISKFNEPANGTAPLYSPVFSYTKTDGTQATAALGLASPEFNFEIGSEHTILYNPAKKGDIRFPGFTFAYFGAVIILSIGAMFALISLVLWIWVKTIARKRDLKKD